MLHSFGNLRGYALHATDGEIGSLRDLYFDDSSTLVRYLVVDTGTWLPGRQVLVAPAVAGGIDAEDRQIVVGLTRARIEDSPPIDSAKPVSRQQEVALHDHYGWDPYWATPPLAAGVGAYWSAPLPPMADPGSGDSRIAKEPAAIEAARHDPHLRSAGEVTGYSVGATDGDIGHVEDLLIGDDDWAIELLVIDTRNWLPGRKVTISPHSLRGVDWVGRRIEVDLTKGRIEGSPEFDPASVPDQGYLKRLLDHYGVRIGS